MLLILLAVFLSCWSNSIARSTDPFIKGNQPIANISRHFYSGGKKSETFHLLPKIVHEQSFIDTLPEEFDARKQWPYCPSINEIRDQGQCGSCWAFGAIEAITDRICIHSGGKIQKHLSTEEVVGCDRNDLVSGCNGSSDVEAAYKYWVSNGIVTGGGYNSNQGCLPYEVPSCVKYYLQNKPCPFKQSYEVKCEQSCRPGYDVPFKADKSYGLKYYGLQGEKNMMAEIIKNGPISIYIIDYGDLLDYKGGVYSHPDGENFIDGHIMKIIGWGVENGVKYWTVANSWGNLWGLGGFLKFLRGENNCSIESQAVAGFPRQ